MRKSIKKDRRNLLRERERERKEYKLRSRTFLRRRCDVLTATGSGAELV
jgi:hypothetical protein